MKTLGSNRRLTRIMIRSTWNKVSTGILQKERKVRTYSGDNRRALVQVPAVPMPHDLKMPALPPMTNLEALPKRKKKPT